MNDTVFPSLRCFSENANNKDSWDAFSSVEQLLINDNVHLLFRHMLCVCVKQRLTSLQQHYPWPASLLYGLGSAERSTVMDLETFLKPQSCRSPPWSRNCSLWVLWRWKPELCHRCFPPSTMPLSPSSFIWKEWSVWTALTRPVLLSRSLLMACVHSLCV